MYSGGLDSLGALYLLLTDPKYADFNIHAHHLVLKNLENRYPAEHRAVHRSIEWLREHGIRPFSFTQSVHDYAFMKRYFIFDSYWYGFMAANIVTADPAIRSVAIGRTRSDYVNDDPNWLTIANRGRDIYTATLPLELRYSRPYVYPVLELDKQEIWDFLPSDLRTLSWSCRTPVYQADQPRACGKCTACQARDNIQTR